ncbi:14322_t:CDS:2, partial [Rhizophagus irregularis]
KSTLNKRQHKFGNQLKQHVQVEGSKIYGKDQVVLKQISYSIRDMDFQIDYEEKNDIKEKKLISAVQAIDLNYIPREGYRALAAVESNLQQMNQKIPITLINLPLDFAEDSNSEIIQNIKKGGTRSVKDILKYIVPTLISNEILDINNPIIHLR